MNTILETKCGCGIIRDSRQHDEARCDNNGENWICADCYQGEYDDEEEEEEKSDDVTTQQSKVNVWLMTPANKNIQQVKYDFNLHSKFPNGLECSLFLINGYDDYYVVFYDRDDEGAYNQSAKWIAPNCEVAPTGNFIIMRKKWIDGDEHTVEMEITPKEFKQKYLK